MTQNLSEAAGQLLIVGFHGTEAPQAGVEEALRAGQIGGVILFARNIGPGDEGLRQLAALNARLDACRAPDGAPPFIAVDQEGGRVRRLRHGVTLVPAMARLGERNDPDLAARVSEVIATELSLLGFNLNFAPVMDVSTNPDNDVIGDRAFGSDPERVAALAGAFTVGHYVASVVPCAKHFPGHGDTLIDSHHDLPVLHHDLARLDAVELVPFKRAIKSGIPMIMTAHLLIPALDPDHPVTLSPLGVGHLLRERLKFKGVIISDDLEMKAIADRYPIEDVVELGLAAGLDIFLICHTEEKWRRAHAHLVHLGQRDPIAHDRILAAAARVRDLKARLLPSAPYEPPPDLLDQLDTPAHRAILAAL